MRRITKIVLAVAAALTLAGVAGCALERGSDELPTAGQYADTDYYDPWNGVERQFHFRGR